MNLLSIAANRPLLLDLDGIKLAGSPIMQIFESIINKGGGILTIPDGIECRDACAQLIRAGETPRQLRIGFTFQGTRIETDAVTRSVSSGGIYSLNFTALVYTGQVVTWFSVNIDFGKDTIYEMVVTLHTQTPSIVGAD